MLNERLFSAALRSIPVQAEAIQRALDCTVWNGNARNEGGDASGSNASVLLREIGKTGRQTQAVFESSISRLHTTIVSSALQDAGFIAALAIDIMDRNLYERANDCRWWALTRTFREKLSSFQSLSPETLQEFSEILAYINNLYTVYTNLVLFDCEGVIVAASNPAEQGLVGQPYADSLVEHVLKLRDSQQYAVSAFHPSDLYASRPTFVYGAAIRDLAGRGCGGIGIVFDSEPQFAAMLEESMPRDSNDKLVDGAIGMFVDMEGLVISAFGGNLKPGDKVDMPKHILQPSRGRSVSCVNQYEGCFYATGSRLTQGYREYKGKHDAYQYQLVAIVMIPLGMISDNTAGLRSMADMIRRRREVAELVSRRTGAQYATFFAGGYWLAVAQP